MIVFDLIRHRYWEYKRNPQFYGSTFAKVLMYLGGALFSGYLLLFGFLTPFMFEDIFPAYEPYHMLGKWLFMILALDLLVRFTYQKPPSSNIKPYYLLPIRRKKLINLMLLSSVASLHNVVWLFFIIPFASISVTPFYGFSGFLGFVLIFETLIVINNLLYIVFRILFNKAFYYIFLPLCLYGGIIALLFLPDCFIPLFFISLGDWMAADSWAVFAISLVLLAVLWLVAFSVLDKTLRQEMSMTPKGENKVHVTDYSFFDRLGSVGEYMKLEMKMVVRNKSCRSHFIIACAAIVMFVFLLFVDAYTSTFMQSFVIVYIYSVLGIMMLSMAMSYEGNYIDCLLIRRVSILTLLRAKYYLNCLFALLPMLFVIPLIVDGRETFGACFALFLFTCGVIFPLVLQLAVYNKKTAPLNDTVNVKSSSATGISTLITMIALFAPSLILTLLVSLFEPLVVNIILAVTGVAGIVTSDYWLANIYKRFNARKYKNLEGFRATR